MTFESAKGGAADPLRTDQCRQKTLHDIPRPALESTVSRQIKQSVRVRSEIDSFFEQ
jgi:hypothetical protein